MELNAMKIIEGNAKILNPLTKMWRVVDTSSMLHHGLSEYLKLAEITTVFVLGSVEDKHTFSTLLFMKDKLQNRLQTHLPLVVSIHEQNFYNINTFLYGEAYNDLKTSIRLSDKI